MPDSDFKQLRAASHAAERQLELRRKCEQLNDMQSANRLPSQNLADALIEFNAGIEHAVYNLERAVKESEEWVRSFYRPEQMKRAAEQIEIDRIAANIKPLYNQMLRCCMGFHVTPQRVIRDWPQHPQDFTVTDEYHHIKPEAVERRERIAHLAEKLSEVKRKADDAPS